MNSFLERAAMKKKLKRRNKGFVLIESLVALTILTFTLFHFYAGQSTFVLQIKKQQAELRAYRVLYEEVVAARAKQIKQPIFNQVARNGEVQIEIDLRETPSVGFSTVNQKVAIFREK